MPSARTLKTNRVDRLQVDVAGIPYVVQQRRLAPQPLLLWAPRRDHLQLARESGRHRRWTPRLCLLLSAAEPVTARSVFEPVVAESRLRPRMRTNVCDVGCDGSCLSSGPQTGSATRADESLISLLLGQTYILPLSPVSAAPSELDSRHHGSLPPRFHPDREPGPAQARHGASPAPNPRAKSPR